MKTTTRITASLLVILSLLLVSCQKETSVEHAGKAGGTARYSLDGGTGACTGAVVAGTFTAGTAATSANTVTLSVTVDSVGSYEITTDAVNGVSFSGSGVFTATGVQTIKLVASGTPVAAGVANFTPGDNGCSFAVAIAANPGNPGGGNPGGGNPGSGSGNFLKCKINGVLTNFNVNLGGLYVVPPSAGIPYGVTVRGTNSDVTGSVEELWVSVSNPTAPNTGIYNNLTITAGATERRCLIALYPTAFPNPYWGSSAFTANTSSVDIKTVSTSAATGTFTGALYENNGLGPQTKQITEGEFKITY